MSKVDLHIHTTASDGKHSPADIVQKAAALGLEFIAISDHDTVNGIAEALSAASATPSLTVIPAVELSTDVPRGEVHVLGYFINYLDVEFEANLARMRNSRIERARQMVEKLDKLGIHIEFTRVQEIAGTGTLGRPHVAQVMLERGYIANFRDAFSHYIGHGGPAYVERDKLTPAEAVQLILKTGGLPVLAHPLTTGDAEATIIELKPVGLVGIEAYYAGYSFEDANPLFSLASRYGLVATGGTDYHGIDENAETMIGGVEVPLKVVRQLVALAEERGLAMPGFYRKGS